MCNEINKTGDISELSIVRVQPLDERKKREQTKLRIEDLVSNMPADYVPEEINWGEPQGKEVC